MRSGAPARSSIAKLIGEEAVAASVPSPAMAPGSMRASIIRRIVVLPPGNDTTPMSE